MAYNQFTIRRVVADFGLTLGGVPDLFPGVPPVAVPPHVRDDMTAYAALAVSEAGRSQYLIAPLIGAVWRAADYRLALFPGVRFDVDEAAGLTGACDFIVGRPPQVIEVTAPVLMVVGAKNEDIPGGLGQCAAAVVAAQRFNQGLKSDVRVVYGAVTDGERWRFLRLADDRLDIEAAARPAADPDRVYGILLHIGGLNPPASTRGM